MARTQKIAVKVRLNGMGDLPIEETWIRVIPFSYDDFEISEHYLPQWQDELDNEVIYCLRGEVLEWHVYEGDDDDVDG